MTIPPLPTEIFDQIVADLSFTKIGRFDNTHKRDLQSLRLVSRRIKDIATPFLFENLRTGGAGLLTMTAFWARHPELARHVHGLQLLITIVPKEQLLTEIHDDVVRVMKEVESQDERHARILLNLFLEPFEKLLDEFPAFQRGTPSVQQFIKKTSESLINLAKALRNLKHFETTSSKHWSTFFINGADTLYNQTGRMIHGMKLDDDFLESETGFAAFLGLAVAAKCKPAHSYKFDYLCLRTSCSIADSEAADFFPTIHTLDLGLCSCMLTGYQSKDSARLWIPLLNQLSNLSTLQLVLTHSMQDVHDTPNHDQHKLLLDDLFLYYGKMPNGQGDGYHLELKERWKLPKLTSVTFKNWVVTTSALHYFLYAHRHTLKSVNLERVSLRIPHNGDRRGWSFIARACQEHLLGLQDLRLSNLYTHQKVDLDRTPPPGFPAVVIVRRLHAEDYAELDRIAFSKSGDGESGMISAVKDATALVDPMVECWWPEGSSG